MGTNKRPSVSEKISPALQTMIKQLSQIKEKVAKEAKKKK